MALYQDERKIKTKKTATVTNRIKPPKTIGKELFRHNPTSRTPELPVSSGMSGAANSLARGLSRGTGRPDMQDINVEGIDLGYGDQINDLFQEAAKVGSNNRKFNRYLGEKAVNTRALGELLTGGFGNGGKGPVGVEEAMKNLQDIIMGKSGQSGVDEKGNPLLPEAIKMDRGGQSPLLTNKKIKTKSKRQINPSVRKALEPTSQFIQAYDPFSNAYKGTKKLAKDAFNFIYPEVR